MTDHAQEMLDRLVSQFADKPYLKALITVLGDRLTALEQVFTDLKENRWLDTSEGEQLDGCGEIVDQDRLIDKAIALPFFGFESQTSGRGFGKARIRKKSESYLSSATLADAEYLKMIKAKIAKNTSQGTTEETIQSFSTVFDDAKIVITEHGNATMRVGVGRELTEAEQIFAAGVDLFVRPGGVQINIKNYFDPDTVFGFENQGYKGFGVGKFTTIF
ncbi:MAG: hypothetical protein H6Q72_4589 [Firmicutes bacterium]|nr:hypothetical protein [Bacillota bacterium]